MVRKAKKAGLDALAITDHNCLFPKNEAQHLSKEFDILVIPGIEGGNIAIRKHWIAVGVDHPITKCRIDAVLSSIQHESGLSIAPHPHTRLGYAEYARIGFDAVESLNGTEPAANRRVKNSRHIPEVAGSDAHALPMLGYTWTEVDAEPTVESILESVRKGRCRPGGSTIPFIDLIGFYPQYILHRILREPRAACNAARTVIRDIRMERARESRYAVHHDLLPGDQISS
jgi:predicted metal-dependent phosphoesterase TrpH